MQRRIAEFLATVEDREERQALLQDAITPPAATAGPHTAGRASLAGSTAAGALDSGRGAAAEDQEGVAAEDQLHTTPLQLLQVSRQRLFCQSA